MKVQNHTLKSTVRPTQTSRRFEVTISSNRCKGCAICIAFCPVKTLEMGKKLNARGIHYATVIDQKLCIGCLQCAEICPDAAITVERVEI